MNTDSICKCRDYLSEVKESLQGIMLIASDVCNRISQNGFVPVDLVTGLSTALKDYAEKYSTLQDGATEFAFSFEMGTLESLEQLLDDAEEKIETEQIQNVILDYLRLKSELEDVKKELEKSKSDLIDKRKSSNFGPDLLKPYIITIDRLKNPSVDISDEGFDTIKETLGTAIARAVDKLHITIDENADLSPYLDDLCLDFSTLRTPSIGTCHENRRKSKTSSTPRNIGEIVKSPPALDACDIPADSHIGQENASSYWNSFDGCKYARDIAFEFHDVPAAQLGAKSFKNDAKKRPQFLEALYCVATQKIISKEDIGSTEDNYYVPGEDVLHHLLKESYITKIEVTAGGITKDYLTLTSKGWEIYSNSKSDAFKYVKNEHKGIYFVQKPFVDKIPDWSRADVASLIEIHDYYTSPDIMSNYYVIRNDTGKFFYSLVKTDPNLCVLPAIFDKLDANEFIQFLQKEIPILREKDMYLTVLVKSRDDQERICSVLSLDVASDERVDFYICP